MTTKIQKWSSPTILVIAVGIEPQLLFFVEGEIFLHIIMSHLISISGWNQWWTVIEMKGYWLPCKNTMVYSALSILQILCICKLEDWIFIMPTTGLGSSSCRDYSVDYFITIPTILIKQSKALSITLAPNTSTQQIADSQ